MKPRLRPDAFLWKRRDFLKACAAAAGAVLPSQSLSDTQAGHRSSSDPGFEQPGAQYPDAGQAGTVTKRGREDQLASVRPAIGTGWHGHTFPGAVAPFGMVQLSPDTSGPAPPDWNGQGDYYQWDHCSGYHHRDNVILGFTHTHLQGSGGIELGDILVMPMVAGRNWNWGPGAPDQQAQRQIQALGLQSGWVFSPVEGGSDPGYRSFFSHERETVHAGYYRVHLETPDVLAELTATVRCGMHRYVYPDAQTARQGWIVDLVHGLGNEAYAANVTVESNSLLSGSRSSHGGAASRQIYFVMESEEPAASILLQVDGKVLSPVIGGTYSGREIKVMLTRVRSARPLMLRTGISPVSCEGARRNLTAEIPHWDFGGIVRQNRTRWRQALKTVDAKLPDVASTEIFETALYHSQVAPAIFDDVNGATCGMDRRNYLRPGFTPYTALSIWDIFRSQFPLLTILQPDRIDDILRTLLAGYDQIRQHALPMWSLWGNETWGMDGFHAAAMLLGAYVRGFRGFDANAAYAAIRDTALQGTEAKENREKQRQFRTLGYVPMNQFAGSVSISLDLAYDFWCAGAMAGFLGKQEDAAEFFRMAKNYRKLFDFSTGFMRGRSESGEWRTPFRPDQEYADYVESDAWQASFNVMHDVRGLIDLYGGDERFVAMLDAFFAAPSYVHDSRPDVTGMVGQHAQGNEPSHHIPYLYPFAGAPWKTQHWVRRIARLYRNTPEGIPGNEDCGQLSSWYIFTALGFYPVNGANGVYVLGSPLVTSARLRIRGGEAPFRIVVDRNSAENVYVARAELNGKEMTRAWFTHADLVPGGELLLRMSAIPEKEWASSPSERPPSGLVEQAGSS